MSGSAREAPVPKPEPPQKGPDLTSQTPELRSSGNKRSQDRSAPSDDAVHWLLGGGAAGQPIQRKPIDAGYSDIVTAASAGIGRSMPDHQAMPQADAGEAIFRSSS